MGEDVPVRRGMLILRRDFAFVDEPLRHGMVAGDLGQLACRVSVQAGITHVPEIRDSPAFGFRRQYPNHKGRAHFAHIAHGLCPGNHGLMSLVEYFHQFCTVRAQQSRVTQTLAGRVYRNGAGHFTSQQPAHAIGQHDKASIGITMYTIFIIETHQSLMTARRHFHK